MAFVRPFCGVHFKEKNITRLICPPYDIIPGKEKERLKEASPYNMVRLELPDAAGHRNKYQQSRLLFRQWQEKGVLVTESSPSFYFYEQTFADRGRKRTRRGFFAALKLENPRQGKIKPHEKTLSKPKEDRLKLLRAVQANISPIFGLFYDRNRELVHFSRKLSATPPLSLSVDKEGTKHRLWAVSDPANVRRVVRLLETQNIFIADGHHRYETAWNYLQERKKKGKGYSLQSEYNYVLAFLCPMEDPGLVIWPTHRVVAPPADLEDRIREYFDVLNPSAFSGLSSRSPQPLLIYKDGVKRALAVKNNAVLQRAMPDKCRAYRELGVSILHSLLLPGTAPDKITYVKDENEAYRLARERGCIAVIVPSTPIEAVKDIALAGQTMPQKSTYFFPKVATGMVIHKV